MQATHGPKTDQAKWLFILEEARNRGSARVSVFEKFCPGVNGCA